MSSIFVSSSWRNSWRGNVVDVLRGAGHEVFDFKNPGEGKEGFHWSELDRNWRFWNVEAFKKGLGHPKAAEAFEADLKAMERADVFVGVLPFGRSSGIELGWAAGRGKKVILYAPEFTEAELMFRLLGPVCSRLEEVLDLLNCPADRTMSA